MDYDLERYDRFGWDYEHHVSTDDHERAWYERFARRTGGPVLDLACGTGRLLGPIASAGFDVAGVDLSQTMLDLARQRIAGLPPTVRQRIQLHRQDMSRFQLDRRFGLAYIADNSFRELKTRPQHLSCLRCVYDHLRPGGTFLMTERRFDPASFVDGRKALPWSEPIQNPATGERVSRRIEIELSNDAKWIRGVMIYKTLHRDGRETTHPCPFEAPVLLTDDYLALFDEVGFSTTVFVGYEERPDDSAHPILCFVCDKPQG